MSRDRSPAASALALDGRDLPVQQIAEQVEVVHDQVVEGVGRPALGPSSPVADEDCLGRRRGVLSRGCEVVAERLRGLPPSPVEPHHGRNLGRALLRPHPGCLVEGGRERGVHQGGYPCLERLDGELGVGLLRRGDDDGVHHPRRQQSLHRLEGPAPWRCPGDQVPALGARVVGGREPGTGNPGEGGQMQPLRRAAAAEDAEEDRRVHGRVSNAARCTVPDSRGG